MTPAQPVRGRRTATRVAGWMEPMLATLVSSLPDSRGWVFERKLDGIRALSYPSGLYSRNKLPLDGSFPEIVEALAALPRDSVLDGEVVAIVGGKIAGFEALQKRTLRTRIRYYIFDVLAFEGRDVRPMPLRERKRILRGIQLGGSLRRTTARTGDASTLLDRACGAGWEGLIAKCDDAPYRGGRTRDWLKLKCVSAQEFVIGGYTDPKGGRVGFGALLLGYYEDGALRYAGEVGTGFSEQTLRELGARLERLRTDRSPFADYPRAMKGQHFVKPVLVAQVGFSEWTREGKLRHPRFQGLRVDKRPEKVVRERLVR